MATFFRGAGIGTYWHANNALLSGFTAQFPGGARNFLNHIRVGTTNSPYISLTRSFGVAWSYAMGGHAVPTAANPAYVYEIDISDPLPPGVTLIDPISDLARTLPAPQASFSYQHDGLPGFLLGVIDPSAHSAHLSTPVLVPPPAGAVARPATLSPELEVLVRGLRDAELLAIGSIPQACVIHRHSVF